MQDFEQALRDWQVKSWEDKTWENFKRHFKDSKNNLKQIWVPTMQQAGYHHANMLAAQLRDDINSKNDDIFSGLK